MKLRNKKTREIKNVNHGHILVHFNDGETKSVGSLAELNEEWEDYEEQNNWGITMFGGVCRFNIYDEECSDYLKEIGNYFESKIEAEKALKKLKAWKRLKDKGFRFTGWATNEGIRGVDFEVPDSFFSEHNHSCISDETKGDLDLLFGGEK